MNFKAPSGDARVLSMNFPEEPLLKEIESEGSANAAYQTKCNAMKWVMNA